MKLLHQLWRYVSCSLCFYRALNLQKFGERQITLRCFDKQLTFVHFSENLLSAEHVVTSSPLCDGNLRICLSKVEIYHLFGKIFFEVRL